MSLGIFPNYEAKNPEVEREIIRNPLCHEWLIMLM